MDWADLREIKRTRRVSFPALALATGYSEKHLQKVFYGRRLGSVEVWDKVTSALGLSGEPAPAHLPRGMGRPRKDGKEHGPRGPAMEDSIKRIHTWTFDKGGRYRLGAVDFIYDGKSGRHHVFRAVSGGYRATWTDAQLLGVKIKEVRQC